MTTPALPTERPDEQFEANYADQVGIFDPSKVDEVVTVIGVGGIGASILPTVLTMGFTRFLLWDPDLVEDRNVTTNLIFRPKDLYEVKVERVKEYLLDNGATEVEIRKEAFTGQEPLSGLVISGVDTMKARKEIWPHVVNGDVFLYMDGRIGGQHATLLTVEPFNPVQAEWYEKYWLFDDEKAAPLPCTARTVVYPAVALGAFMAAYLARWSRGESMPAQTDINFADPDVFFQTLFIGDDA
jgi:hypothetical protein